MQSTNGERLCHHGTGSVKVTDTDELSCLSAFRVSGRDGVEALLNLNVGASRASAVEWHGAVKRKLELHNYPPVIAS